MIVIDVGDVVVAPVAVVAGIVMSVGIFIVDLSIGIAFVFGADISILVVDVAFVSNVDDSVVGPIDSVGIVISVEILIAG